MAEASGNKTQKAVEAAEIARKYDLTETMIPFLDRHLIFHLIDFLSSKGLYNEHNLLELKYNLLKDTNMVDYVQDLWKQLNPGKEVSKEFAEKREVLLEQMAKLEARLEKFFKVLESPEVQDNLKQDKVQNLRMFESHNITAEDINNLYYLGQLKFSTGEYRSASEMLDQFRIISTDNQLIQSATWGKFAIEIIGMNVDAVTEEMQKLRDIIDQRTFSDPLNQLHNRTWIIHWSLFLFISKDFNKESLIDLFFSPSYIATIQASCPWIIRYLAAAVISLNNKGRNVVSFQRRLKDLVRVVGQELYEYQDPVTDFIRALYIDFDFSEAQNKLSEAEAVLSNDFFLNGITSDFLESARHLVSELYCRIHQRIDVTQLSTRLNLNTEQGEKWIANLIKDTKMDAKIDESNGTVIMNHPITAFTRRLLIRPRVLLLDQTRLWPKLSTRMSLLLLNDEMWKKIKNSLLIIYLV